MTKPLVLFDLTRLLTATGRAAPTGIERVEYAYARWLLARRQSHVRFVLTMNRAVRLVADDAVPAFLERQAETWSRGSRGYPAVEAVSNVNRFLRGEQAPRPPRHAHLSGEERRRLRERRRQGPSARLANWAQTMAARWAREPLDASLGRWRRRRPVVYLRASLDRLEREEPVARLKATGARMVVVCHDVIPLDFPEFVRPNAVAQCAARLETVARHADGVVASSAYSAQRLSSLLGRRRPPTEVAHIGMEAAEPELPEDLPPLADEPFFLVISTIEARKNHLLLLQVWRRLVAEQGAAAPKLVIAGKRGWEAAASCAILDRCEDLSGHVYEAGAVPDAALSLLRRKARAVLMPSYVEGFGMPVMEALAAGTPVIASDIPVFREVAGDAAELVDPLDGPGWARAILDFHKDGSPRLAAARARAARFVPPRWDDYFSSVGGFVDRILADDAAALAPTAKSAGPLLPGRATLGGLGARLGPPA